MHAQKRELIERLQGQILDMERPMPEASHAQKHSGLMQDSMYQDPASACSDSSIETCVSGQSGSTEAFTRIVKLVSFKERSSAGMLARLMDEGFDPDDAHAAIQKALRYSIIDDARFAESLVRTRHAQGRGKHRVESDLASEGIVPSSVPLFVELYENDSDSQAERALQLLRRRPSRSKNPYAASVRKLVASGYEYPVAVSAARAWIKETESAMLIESR